MKHSFHLSALFVLLALSVVSCNKNEDDLDKPIPPGLGGDTWVKGPIDDWIYSNLVKPYNITAKYKWDPWEVNIGATLVPPFESQVIPVLNAVKKIWIEPYNAETGSDMFIKRYSPKQFVLIGSPEFNPNGTVVLGQAEGANKIVLFVVNYFDPQNMDNLRQTLHTIEHEFAHILHQTVNYPEEYIRISTGYTAQWFNESQESALSRGFITPYSMASTDEDFVEMIATMLIEGKTRFDEIVAQAPADAQVKLIRKKNIIIDYFAKNFNINFESLQNRTQAALRSLATVPTIELNFGFNKLVDAISFAPSYTAVNAATGSAFKSIYNSVKSKVSASFGGLSVDSVTFRFVSAANARADVYLSDASGNFLATYTYAYSTADGKTYDFTFTTANGNGNLIKADATELIDYFDKNILVASWLQDPHETTLPKVVLTPQNLANGQFAGQRKQ